MAHVVTWRMVRHERMQEVEKVQWAGCGGKGKLGPRQDPSRELLSLEGVWVEGGASWGAQPLT